jgi:alanyl-tRNA synthetase
MRRAIRFGVKIGFDRPFFHLMADEVIKNFQVAYPELADRRPFIEEIIQSEE